MCKTVLVAEWLPEVTFAHCTQAPQVFVDGRAATVVAYANEVADCAQFEAGSDVPGHLQTLVRRLSCLPLPRTGQAWCVPEAIVHVHRAASLSRALPCAALRFALPSGFGARARCGRLRDLQMRHNCATVSDRLLALVRRMQLAHVLGCRSHRVKYENGVQCNENGAAALSLKMHTALAARLQG